MQFQDDPRISVLPPESRAEKPVEKSDDSFKVSNNPFVSKCFDFEHFDVLDSKYEVLTFEDVKINRFFRWANVKKILQKTGDKWAVEHSKELGPIYFQPGQKDFVLVFAD